LAHVVYSEKYPGGYKVVVPASGEEESEIDLELLFKAIISQKVLKSVIYENQ
jgi:hypothetical protein